MNKFKNLIPLIAGCLFLLTAVTSVASAWISDVHRFDMGISFSSYVGLYHWTSVMYFITTIIMIALLIYYIAKTKMPVIKKIIYAVVMLCIFGTALFPFNYYSETPTDITINLHNDFAIALMLVTTVSFILTAVMSKNKKQRVISLLSLAYAAVFIVLYFIRFAPLFLTFFIWENLFIILLIVEMHAEKYGEIAAESKAC